MFFSSQAQATRYCRDQLACGIRVGGGGADSGGVSGVDGGADGESDDQSAVYPTGRVHDDHYGYGIIRPDVALTFDIPPGPPEGPLKQAGAAASDGATADAVVAAPVARVKQGGGGGMQAAGVVGVWPL
jgi:hypothetical protein